MLIGEDLKRCEKIIARAIEIYSRARGDAGSAFIEIRDGYCTHVKDSKGNPKKGLYHERGFTRFDTYCANQWGLTDARVNQLIADTKVTTTVVSLGLPAPANEAQTRELGRASDPAAVWQGVVEEHEPGDITAAVIREHVQRSAPSPVATIARPESTSDRILRELEEAVAAALEVATVDVVRQVVRDTIEVYS